MAVMAYIVQRQQMQFERARALERYVLPLLVWVQAWSLDDICLGGC